MTIRFGRNVHVVYMINIVLFLICWWMNNSLCSVMGRQSPFQLGIRDSFMIAHSFHNHPSFGPAGALHGATYTCDVEFGCTELDPNTSWVIDIGYASTLLSNVLTRYNYKNLDTIFGKKVLTTTEFMCQQIYNDIVQEIQKTHPNFRGEICVKLWESHKAWASYTGPV